MASNITANTKAAFVAIVKIIYDRLTGAIVAGGYTASVDAARVLAGITALPLEGQIGFGNATREHRARLAQIKEDGRRMLDPILAQMGYEAGSRTVDGSSIDNYPRLFLDINADLLGGTPDYIDPRAVTFAANPAISATGIFRRLTKDIQNEPIEDGYHNQTKTIRITSKPVRYQSVAQIEGAPSAYADELGFRAGRPRISTGLIAVNDSQQPSGIYNPYLTPSDLTHDASITSVPNWTLNTSGGPTFKVDTGVLWRGRTYSTKFTGANAAYVELTQVIPAAVFADPFRPWDLGVPIRLTTGWQGTIDLTWGGKTQQFTHADLTNGSFVHLFPDLDQDLYPKRFDAAGAMWKLKLTNSQVNTDYIYIGGYLPYPMIKHEGVHYSHFSDASEPTVESTKTYADTATAAGKLQDVLSFCYADLAPGEAHFPTSGATTISDPA